MEQEITILKNGKLLFLVLTVMMLTTINCFAQQTEPAFVYQNIDPKKANNLQRFLGSVKYPFRDSKCLKATGTFKFKVGKNGKIDSLLITGNLPDTIVSIISQRISETEKYWVFSQKYDNAKSYKWFVLPVFIEFSIGQECNLQPEVGITWEWVEGLFDKKTFLLNTPTSYLLKPLYFFGIS